MAGSPSAPDLVNYRRGTVVGLTLAEIFILLLFLLLLAFFALDQVRDDELQSKNEELRDKKAELKSVEQNLQQAETELRNRTQALQHQEKETEKANERLANANEALEQARGQLDALRPVAQALDQGNVQQVLDEIVTLSARATKAEQQAGEYRDQLAEVSEQLAEVAEQRDAEQARSNAIRQALATEKKQSQALQTRLTKGVDPPCWYQTVPDSRKPGGIREKPYYTFDVAVFDDHVVFRSVQPPPGRAEDDGGDLYANEAKKLRLEALPYDQPLKYEEVSTAFKRIRDAGMRPPTVRTYSCIFFVRVWDKTSEDAKKQWRHAHENVLEGLFGTYLVRDDPWGEDVSEVAGAMR